MPYNPASAKNLKKGTAMPVEVEDIEEDDEEEEEKEVTCCLECHFKFEEEHVLHFLPPRARSALLRDHAKIRRNLKRHIVDAELLITHAEAGEALFAEYVPIELRERMTRDHERIDAVVRFIYSIE